VAVFVGYRGTAAGGAGMGHGVSLGLTVPLPLFDSGQGEASRAEAERALAEASAERTRRGTAADAQVATARLLALEASRAEQARAESDATALEDAATALYVAGELSIVEVLDAFRGAEEARLARVESAEAVAMARLALMRARATFFDVALDQACGLAAKDRR
jgi:outer membrane protein TolC